VDDQPVVRPFASTFVALDSLGIIPHRDRPPCVTDEAYVRDTRAVADFLFEESRADRPIGGVWVCTHLRDGRLVARPIKDS